MRHRTICRKTDGDMIGWLKSFYAERGMAPAARQRLIELKRVIRRVNKHISKRMDAKAMEAPLFFEDIVAGQIWVSPHRTVTETDVVNFAAMSGDFNPLHVDHQYAAQSHYRKPIAHGLLGLSWVAGLGSNAPNVHTIAFCAVRNWEFIKPIYFGETVYVETLCLEKSESGRRTGKVHWHRKLLNQRDEVVQQGIFETLVAMQGSGQKLHFKAPSGIGSARTGKVPK
jgi:acyl dehydratase